MKSCIFVTAAAFTVLAANMAQATVYKYDYAGLPVYCHAPCPSWWGGDDFGKLHYEDGWTGSITIDETLLPGGKLANSTLVLRTVELYSYGEYDYRYSYELTTASGGTFSGTWEGEDWSPAAFLSFDGLVASFLNSTIQDSMFEFDFGENAEIIDWSGYHMSGGSDDRGTSSTRDGRAAGGVHSDGPGTWTMSVVGAPLPVPLPASLPLLLGALGAVRLLSQGQRHKAL